MDSKICQILNATLKGPSWLKACLKVAKKGVNNSHGYVHK